MIDLHDAILAINPSITTMRGDVAYDADENIIEYDLAAAQAKLAELQAAETAKQEAEIAAKASAQSKLAALGLTPEEITAIIGS